LTLFPGDAWKLGCLSRDFFFLRPWPCPPCCVPLLGPLPGPLDRCWPGAGGGADCWAACGEGKVCVWLAGLKPFWFWAARLDFVLRRRRRRRCPCDCPGTGAWACPASEGGCVDSVVMLALPGAYPLIQMLNTAFDLPGRCQPHKNVWYDPSTYCQTIDHLFFCPVGAKDRTAIVRSRTHFQNQPIQDYLHRVED